MSFDAFETRLQFLQLLRKLNASQPSIQKVVSYAIKYGSRCGEDLWECIMEECSKGSLNTRINILYFLDSLLEACQPLSPADAPYLDYVAKDLGELVDRVVPASREGVLNLKSAHQILDSWRLRRLTSPEVVEDVIRRLDARKTQPSSPKKRSQVEAFSRSDILRRMEEDRERHKRLRERIWILPIPSLSTTASTRIPPSRTTSAMMGQSPSSNSPATPASPSRTSLAQAKRGVAKEGKMAPPPVPTPGKGDGNAQMGEVPTKSGKAESALQVEFHQIWDTVEDFTEEDLERMRRHSYLARAQNASVNT